MLGLYIHIPFCNQICPYCDFYKMVVTNKTKEKVLNALCEEMKIKKLHNYSFDCVYIGGGTPSSLDIKQLDFLLTQLKQLINLKSIKEFTIEVNPNDITIEFIKLCKKYHINRISIGVQTFQKRLQQIIKRPFNYDDLKSKIDMFRNNQINNINLDLIYAIPTQSFNELDSDLNLAIKLNPEHLSVYSLILEEHTEFYYQFSKGNLKLIDEDLEASMYDHILTKLKMNNYEHYETSNFAKKGYQSKHNLIYWNCDEYIGIGPSAASYINNYRITNYANLEKYFKSLKNEISLEKTFISKEESMKEFIMLGLRKVEGISQKMFFEKFQIDLKKQFPMIIELIREGSLLEENEFIKIKEDYFYISNYFIKKII